MATRIQFRCAPCGYIVRVPISYAGKKGKCPGCKVVLRIPADPSAEAGRLPAAPPVTAARPKKKTSARNPGAKRSSRAKAQALPGAGAKPPPSMPRSSEAPTRRMARVSEPALPALAPPTEVLPPLPKRGPPGERRSHLFIRVGAEPLRLQPGTPIVIGRSQECDLTIPSSRVSRRHAQLVWRGDQPILEDLGSQNGTLVDGKPIRAHRLVDKDEVLIGPFLIRYVNPRAGEEPEALDYMADSDMKTEFTLVDAMAGRLEEVTLYEVLQTLEFNKKTGTLDVTSKAGGAARIGIEQGAVVFARLGPRRGREAVLEALGWDEGRFALKPGLAHAQDVRLPITGLLLDASRRLDEG